MVSNDMLSMVESRMTRTTAPSQLTRFNQDPDYRSLYGGRHGRKGDNQEDLGDNEAMSFFRCKFGFIHHIEE